jgi:hypothetical protein
MRFSQKEIGDMVKISIPKLLLKHKKMSFSIKTLRLWDFIKINKIFELYIFILKVHQFDFYNFLHENIWKNEYIYIYIYKSALKSCDKKKLHYNVFKDL